MLNEQERAQAYRVAQQSWDEVNADRVGGRAGFEEHWPSIVEQLNAIPDSELREEHPGDGGRQQKLIGKAATAGVEWGAAWKKKRFDEEFQKAHDEMESRGQLIEQQLDGKPFRELVSERIIRPQ